MGAGVLWWLEEETSDGNFRDNALKLKDCGQFTTKVSLIFLISVCGIASRMRGDN